MFLHQNDMKIKKLVVHYKEISIPVKASFWYTICNITIKGLALFSTPIFTRMLSEEEYGIYSIFQSWYGILLIFTSLNIFLGGYTKGLILFKENSNEFTSASLALVVFITCCYGLIYLMNPVQWSQIFDLKPSLMYVMFLELLFMPALEFWAAKSRFEYRYKAYVFVTLISSILSIGLGIVAVSNTQYKIEARIYTDVFAKVVVAAILFALIFVKGKAVFRKKYWMYSLKFNIPLIPHYLANYVLNQSDRIMIARMEGNTQAAYYSVAYTISTMMLLITNAVNNSFVPYLYKRIDEGDIDKIRDITKPIIYGIACLCILTMVFAPEVIRVFAGKNYLNAIYVVPPIAASVFFIFLYSLFSHIEYFYQKTGFIAAATSGSAVINLLLNYVFIREYGYYAAGYTTLVCYILLAFTHYLFYRKVLKMELPEIETLYDMKRIVLVSGAVLIVMAAILALYRFTVVRYCTVLLLAMILVIKRKTVADKIENFKK